MKHRGHRSLWVFLAAVVVAIVVAVLNGGVGWLTSRGLDKVVNGPSAVATRSSSPTAKPSRDPLAGQHAVAAMDACGPEAQVSRRLPDAEICVLYWCKGEVFSTMGIRSRTSLQIKLRPRITNNSDHALDVSVSAPSAVLLVVAGSHVKGRWEPPPATQASGRAPRLLRLDGGEYWGLPPNVNNDVTSAGNGYYTGFASTWDVSSVRAGSSYLETARNSDGSLVHHGNLVFQVPMDAHGEIHPLGLALVSRNSGKVLAFQRFDDWGRPSAPTSF